MKTIFRAYIYLNHKRGGPESGRGYFVPLIVYFPRLYLYLFC